MILDLHNIPARAIAAIDSRGVQLSYGDLRQFAAEVDGKGIKRKLAFAMVRNDVGGIAWIIAMLEAGIVPVILNYKTDKSLLDNLYATYQPNLVLMPQDAPAELEEGNEIMARYGYRLVATSMQQCQLCSELSHLLPTSGSTGSPKLVRHCYGNIEASALNISTFFGLKPSERALLVLPLYYTMGLSVVFSHLKVGATVLITDLPMTDRNFWAFIKNEKATSFTGVPYSFEILNLMRFFRMDMPDLKLLTQGGGKMPRELNLKFAEWCRDTGRDWIATYGQSEGTARMAYLPSKWAVEKAGSIGIAVPNGELWLVDDDGNPIESPDVEGEMCYRGKNVTLGYATCRDDLAKGDERHGEMRTGDMAYRDADGCYYITGRKGRFLKLFGMRVGLDECEQIVRSRFAVECAAVGNDEKMTLYFVSNAPDAETLKQQIKEELATKTHIVANAFEVVPIDALPKNEAGKILYAKLK